jgi:hypothetical protein
MQPKGITELVLQWMHPQTSDSTKPSGERINYTKTVKGIGLVESSDIVKGFEVDKDVYVTYARHGIWQNFGLDSFLS